MNTKLSKTFGLGLAISLAAFSAAQGKITGFQPIKDAENPALDVLGSGLKKPETTKLAHGKQLRLTFDATLQGRAGTKSVRAAGLRSVTYGWRSSKPPRVWVQLNFDKPTEATAIPTEGGWKVVWGPNAAETIAKASAPGLAPIESSPTNIFAKAERAAAFPDKVPPLKVVRSFRPAEAAKPPAPSTLEARVTLDFVNTDVVQVLRALALQANVSIVTAPEVTGKISVALQDITVSQALDFVTTLARLRYAQIGSTFVVTASDRFASAVQQIKGLLDESSETRVVTLASGEGIQIKTSVLKAIPQDTLLGRYEIVLPSEKVTIKTSETATVAQNGQGGQGGGAGGGQGKEETAIQTTTGDPNSPAQLLQETKDPYLVLIGPKNRLNEVEMLVHDLDKKIMTAARLGIAAGISTRVVPVYSAQVARIRDTVKGLIDRDPNKGSYTVNDSVATGVGPENTMTMLLLSGPAESIDTLVTLAKGLDRAICDATGVFYPESQEEANRSYVVVELQYVEPIEAAYELQNRVRGLQASLMPGPADPLMSGGTYERKKDSEKWNSRPPKGSRVFGEVGSQGAQAGNANIQAAGSGQATANGNSNSGSATIGGTGEAQGGAEIQASIKTAGASSKRELGSEPMKLLLYGTQNQIQAGKDLLQILDTKPREVALEIRVASLTKEDALRLGLDWNILTGGVVEAFRMNQGLGDTIDIPGNFSSSGRYKSTEFDVLGKLDKLAGSQKLIARPNLIALNGRPASMFVGDKIQYIKTIQASQNGTTIEIGELDVGVELIVVPRLGANGMMTLDLSPSLTILRGFTPVPGGGNLPQTTERYVQSQVVMKSGETIALGGLIQEEDRRQVNGVPILKDIPIVGQLFSRTDNKKARVEVVFFVTAREVNDDNRANAANPKQDEKAEAKPRNGG